MHGKNSTRRSRGRARPMLRMLIKAHDLLYGGHRIGDPWLMVAWRRARRRVARLSSAGQGRLVHEPPQADPVATTTDGVFWGLPVARTSRLRGAGTRRRGASARSPPADRGRRSRRLTRLCPAADQRACPYAHRVRRGQAAQPCDQRILQACGLRPPALVGDQGRHFTDDRSMPRSRGALMARTAHRRLPLPCSYRAPTWRDQPHQVLQRARHPRDVLANPGFVVKARRVPTAC